jgi:hypothetical protein
MELRSSSVASKNKWRVWCSACGGVCGAVCCRPRAKREIPATRREGRHVVQAEAGGRASIHFFIYNQILVHIIHNFAWNP